MCVCVCVCISVCVYTLSLYVILRYFNNTEKYQALVLLYDHEKQGLLSLF